MGNKASQYVESYTLRKELPELKRGCVKGAFLDYMQFPIGGVIGVSSFGVENFNALNGKTEAIYKSDAEITCVDFDPLKRILLIGTMDGLGKILDSQTLKVIKTLHYYEARDTIQTVSANCRMHENAILGYNNGYIKVFKLAGEGTESIYKIYSLEEKAKTGSDLEIVITNIEISDNEKLIIVSHTNKLVKTSYITIFKSGTSTALISMEYRGGTFLAIKYLEHLKMIVALTSTNELL